MILDALQSMTASIIAEECGGLNPDFPLGAPEVLFAR
jgi:hypothetical protein